MRWLFVAFTIVVVLAPVHGADSLQLSPPEIELTANSSLQQLALYRVDQQTIVADLTTEATFRSSDPKVVEVDAVGELHAVGDGEAIITATWNGQTARSQVRIRGMTRPFSPSFRDHVLPILTKSGCNSGACHGALAGKGGLKLSLLGYDPEADHFALTRQARARRIDSTRPVESLTLLKATRGIKHGGGTRFDDASLEYEWLHQWIADGAPPPAPDAPEVERLEVFPTSARLAEGDQLRVLVRAWYTDGSQADVTRWSRFGSSEQLVAGVDDWGVVSVVGSGQASVTVGFGTHVATVPVVSPCPNEPDAEAFAQFEPRDFIDELILAKLKELNLPPSPTCTDREFIRRAFLDSCGILPTPDEVDAFVKDTRPDKRSRLVDQILEREEFVDYWSYYWSDVLLVSTRQLPEPAMWAFSQWVRRNVAENTSWDRFAADLLTASGSTLRNGAGNFFVLHTDVAELTESTAVTFLGMSITCARCHNHPMEKWTQDQYWSLANLFSRVVMKNGDRAGEVFVQAAPYGDIPHPRREVAMPPTPLDGQPVPSDFAGDRRAYFSDWLTSPDNPYFAKALINRIWANYFGRGLVDAVDDLRQTNPPTNAALFDALADDFIKHGYDVKRLMRQILNSAAYQRSAVPSDENRNDDRFYSHYLIRRLSAEVVLDAYSQVTDVPTPFDEVYTGVEKDRKKTQNYPSGTRALQLPDSRVASRFLDAFGRPDREQTCSCEREDDSSVGQALHLNNGSTLNTKLQAKDNRIDIWLNEKKDDRTIVRDVFAWALSREPTKEEERRFLAELTNVAPKQRREAIEDVLWAVLTSKEFLFNH